MLARIARGKEDDSFSQAPIPLHPSSFLGRIVRGDEQSTIVLMAPSVDQGHGDQYMELLPLDDGFAPPTERDFRQPGDLQARALDDVEREARLVQECGEAPRRQPSRP